MVQLDLAPTEKITVRAFFQCLKAFQASLNSHILFDSLSLILLNAQTVTSLSLLYASFQLIQSNVSEFLCYM